MSPRILIIDDDIYMRNLLNKLLKRKGYETALAEDGQEGVAIAKQMHPDLIILDVVMPRMDGLTASKLIKNYKPLSRVPIIFLSAAASEKDTQAAVDTGVEVYITKPFDVNNLINIVQDMLE